MLEFRVIAAQFSVASLPRPLTHRNIPLI